MRILCLQHVPFEGPAAIAEWAQIRSHTLAYCRLYQSATLPSDDTFDMLVVMGGPMSVHDETKYPWLITEKELIRAAIQNKKTVIGICLGAQLIAEVLGGIVSKNPEKEIGWFPVESTTEARTVFPELPQEFTALHWHGEGFSLPEGAIRLASSKLCLEQGFVFEERVLALQCHLESTEASAKTMVEFLGNELTEGSFIQSAETINSLAKKYQTTCEDILFYMLDRLSLLSSATHHT